MNASLHRKTSAQDGDDDRLFALDGLAVRTSNRRLDIDRRSGERTRCLIDFQKGDLTQCFTEDVAWRILVAQDRKLVRQRADDRSRPGGRRTAHVCLALVPSCPSINKRRGYPKDEAYLSARAQGPTPFYSNPLLAEEASLYFNPKKAFPRGEEGFHCLRYYVAQGPTPSTRCSNSPELVVFSVVKSLNEKTSRAELRVEQEEKTPAPNLPNYKLG